MTFWFGLITGIAIGILGMLAWASMSEADRKSDIEQPEFWARDV